MKAQEAPGSKQFPAQFPAPCSIPSSPRQCVMWLPVVVLLLLLLLTSGHGHSSLEHEPSGKLPTSRHFLLGSGWIDEASVDKAARAAWQARDRLAPHTTHRLLHLHTGFSETGGAQ